MGTGTDEVERQGRDAATPGGDPGLFTTSLVSAAPSSDAEQLDHNVVTSTVPVIQLSGTQTLTPHFVGSSEWRHDQIKFAVSVKAPSLRTVIWFQKEDGTQLAHDEFNGGPLLAPGDQVYAWDGFDDAAQLDTTVLRAGSLFAKISTWDGHDAHVSERIELKTAASKAKWVDVKVDLRAKTVAITTYVSFKAPFFRSVSDATFSAVKQLIRDGIEKYWSRGFQVNQIAYTATTKTVLRDDDSVVFQIMKTAPAIIQAFGLGKRCFNEGTIVPGAPIIFYVDESQPLKQADIMETGAHEFGHSILRDAIDGTTSATHKGTSSVLGGILDSAANYPMQGEIDLMKYHNLWPAGSPGTSGGFPNDYWARLTAVEDDVKRFISVACVEIS